MRNLATNAASRTSHENTSCSEKYKIRGAKGIFRLIFWAIGILLDPLVVYLFYLGDDRKCVQVDKNFGTAICVVHFVVDIINIVFYSILELPADLNESAWIRILLICGNMIIMFPLSLEMLILIHRTKTRTVWNRVALLRYQMVPRIIRLSILTAYGSSSSNLALWAIKLLYSYVYSGEVIGSVWYVLAIYAEARCWQKACRTHKSGCPDREFRDRFLPCNESSEAYKIMNDFCSRNTIEYDFGVFRDAHQSGILEMRNFSLKHLFCFRWAMQTISGFGSNIGTASTDVSGNIFVLCVIYMAVILFYSLIREMQSDVERRKERQNRSSNTS
ncbi:probable cyclic nucleotide-gated ion channel 3 isoform X2 [Pistacia vera]|uniref:probable cyclic nucleotide-gated ion channel 3 isoform X2 n=1 Tax=Pistacia vera TaxID=55513 RepID=UPI0012637516|nr:probable cyclic nucleotide-gated ion channel 3 isoform X2 [Pistacia vera]